MFTRISRFRDGHSAVPASSSANRAQPAQGAQQQSVAPTNTPASQPTPNQGEASGRPAPSRSNTASTVSAPVKHNTFVPKERVAKLSGEGDNRARRAAFIEDALNKYKKAVEAEGNAKKAYENNQKVVDADQNMCGQDWFRAGMYAAELGTAWEKAAYSAATAYEAFKRAAAPAPAPQ